MSAQGEQTVCPFKVGDIVKCEAEDTDYKQKIYPKGTFATVKKLTKMGSSNSFSFLAKDSDCAGGLWASRWSLYSTANTTLPPIPITPSDPVTHPAHYTAHPSDIECITITEHMGFCLGNAMKYIWRADLKADSIQDLRKAVWYLEREITKREKLKP